MGEKEGKMPQMLLPFYPEETTHITALLSFEKRDGWVYYFHGGWPVYTHAEDDLKSFRLFTSQLYVSGGCKQADIVRVFGVSAISVKRWVKKYREKGPKAFYESRRFATARVLVPEVVERAQELLNEGKSRKEVAETLGLKEDTLYRAILKGRLTEDKQGKKKT